MADGLSEDLRTIQAARELAAPQPPQNTLARLIAPSSVIGPETLTRHQVKLTRQQNDRKARQKSNLLALLSFSR